MVTKRANITLELLRATTDASILVLDAELENALGTIAEELAANLTNSTSILETELRRANSKHERAMANKKFQEGTASANRTAQKEKLEKSWENAEKVGATAAAALKKVAINKHRELTAVQNALSAEKRQNHSEAL